MFGVKLVCLGTVKEAYLRQAIAEYEKRLAAYCAFSTLQFNEFSQVRRVLSGGSKTFKIALCIEGKELSSEQLAELISALFSGTEFLALSPALSRNVGVTSVPNCSELMFLIGDSDGIPEDVKSLCDLRLSFSKMTFPHQLMRVILLEQIYRAFSIINGGKYHK